MSRYLELLKLPNARALLITSFPARIAYGMLGLAVFFKVERETGSVAAAGLAIGAFALSQSVTAGIRGTVIDRFGQKWPLRILAPTYCVMVLYFNTLTERNSLLIFALAMGLSSPPINLSVRPLWKIAVKPGQLRTAYALDTSIMNIANVFGPIIATTISLSLWPGLALNSVGILILVGGLSLSFTKIARNSIPEPREVGGIPLWKNKGMQLLMIEGIFIGFGWGAFDVGVPAFATLEKIPGWTGPILGAMGVAAVFGGLYAGMISKRTSALKGLIINYVLWMIFTAPLAFTYPGWSMLIVGVFLGACGGALQVFYWEVLEAVRPQGMAVAALGWLWTVEGAFMALGAAVGGVVASEFSPRATLAITSISIAIGCAIILIGKKALKAADRIPTAEEDLLAMKNIGHMEQIAPNNS